MITESYTVDAADLVATMIAVTVCGGALVASTPVGAGFHITVAWRQP